MRILMALAILLAAAGGAAAQDLSIKAFYGHYSGGGVAETPDSLFFDVTARDLDVVIAPAAGGVRIAWTTVLRKGGDPNNPEVVKKSTEITFKATDRPNLFIEDRNANAFDGAPLSWARIEGQTLTTYTFAIEEDGIYGLATYARTVGPGGMDLLFSSIRDGHPVRSVKAKLVKQGN
jgi:hypothetical protein